MKFKGKKISIFVPVYENSDSLEELLEELTNDSYENKEIFVTIDKPAEKMLKVVNQYESRVTFILNNQREGKVDALNNAVKRSDGEILVFLDSDISIDNSKEFLTKIETNMEGVDILDVKKKIVRNSFIPRMVNYEYVSSNLGNYLYSKLIKRCFGVNGAAFVIKREVFEEVGGFSKVVAEDLDIAVKVLLTNKQFKYTDNVEVYTKAPSSWRTWFVQRKRWGIGTGLWIKDHWKSLIKYVAKYPHVVVPSILILFPTLLPISLSYVFSNFLGYKIIDIVLMLLATRFSFLLPVLFSSSMGRVLLTNLTNFFTSFFFFSVLFYVASRKLKLDFNFLEFTIYYFFYQPLAFFILAVGMITPFLSSKYKLDWKV
ncbi:MAG: hypothetical protein CW716_08795 [Candidatus Bathyarchaeum sp.]|nr:MAG: hypothetical protein CW716_08795 [Candidatus Bathyarchaeum sp.]